MAYRIPRGYAVNRPPYQEISEGIRPSASAVPMGAWTGLPPVRIDDITHDPIVIDAGTVVGIATGGFAVGKLFPAHQLTGATTITLEHHSDGATWGLPATDAAFTSNVLTGGPVLPLGVVFQPIYSFILQANFTNYTRNVNVGIVTDYMIQVPAKCAAEKNIRAGQMVMVHSTAQNYGVIAAGTASMGGFQAWDGTAGTLNFVVGRCFSNLHFATGTATNTILSDDTAAALTTSGAAEYKDLARVNTVPGLGLAGSGTGGVPSWLMKAQSDASGYYYALTILIRL